MLTCHSCVGRSLGTARRARVLGNVVGEHTDSGWKLLAAQIAQVVAAVIGRML